MPFDDRDFPDLPRAERAASPRAKRLVAGWLYAVAFMILVMIGLGGATRLNGSGLSIMEWAPIMGTLPPLTETEWQRLFALYQHIPQYTLINDGFGLEGFKRIFWLEWTHRLWGRAIGVAFLGPLIWFAATGRIGRGTFPWLAGFFVIGGLQGGVGWFMVASGFFPDATAVAPLRLVLHLSLALILYAAILWTALSLWPGGVRRPEPGMAVQGLAWVTLGLAAMTLVAGGFVAGLRAGWVYNTFPLMDGRVVPEGYADLEPFGRNLIENLAAVQFNHRALATLTVISALALTAAAWRLSRWRAILVAAAVTAQYVLGITTLVLRVPAGLGVAHQAGATILLTAVLLVVHAVRPRPRYTFQTGHRLAARLPFRSTGQSVSEEPRP